MKRIISIIFLFCVLFYPTIQLCANSSIVKFVIMSSTNLSKGEHGVFYICISNSYKSNINITDLKVVNKSISIIGRPKTTVTTGETKIIEVRFIAVEHSKGTSKLEIKYTVNNSEITEYISSEEFVIEEKKSMRDKITDLLLPVIIGASVSFIVNYMISYAKRKSEDRKNFQEIRAYLLRELKNHQKRIEKQSHDFQEINWNKIVEGSLYAFCIDYFPKQFSQIEVYYENISLYNSNHEVDEKFYEYDKLKHLNEEVTIIVKRMYIEKGILGHIKSLFKYNILLDTNNLNNSSQGTSG